MYYEKEKDLYKSPKNKFPLFIVILLSCIVFIFKDRIWLWTYLWGYYGLYCYFNNRDLDNNDNVKKERESLERLRKIENKKKEDDKGG